MFVVLFVNKVSINVSIQPIQEYYKWIKPF